MKKSINEAAKLKRLAGLITESEYQEAVMQSEEKEEEAFGGVNERLAPHVFSRMAGLSSYKAQMAMIKAAEVMMRELVDEGFEVEEIREYFNQLIANDI